MAKVICMASAKGGSGKTILTATFATALTSLGKKVLIIDTDASTNGLTLMYLKEVMVQGEYAIGENRKPLGTFEIENVYRKPEIVILPTMVELIPASYHFKNTESTDLTKFSIGLHHIIKLYFDDYDYIFLDAQAGSDNYANLAMKKDISNEVIIVSEYDPLSAAGIERLKGLFREDLTYNRTWVLLNKMLPDFIKSFSDFLEVAKYLSPIPWDAEVVKAYARRKLALDMENGNEYTLAIIQTLKALLGDEISKEIKKWTNDKESLIRQPIEIQYSDIKKQLNNLNIMKYQEVKKRRMKLWLQTGIIVITAIAFVLIFYIYRSSLGFSKISFSDIVVPVAFSLTLLSLGFALFLNQLDHNSWDKNDFRQAEIDELKEKLKKLDALMSAEIDLLIKNKNSSII